MITTWSVSTALRVLSHLPQIRRVAREHACAARALRRASVLKVFERLRRSASATSPELKQADILSISHANDSFDLVMVAHVLEPLPEPRRALEEMFRVLKPGGPLLVCLTRRSNFGALIQLRWRTWTITEPQGVLWLEACGFEDIKRRLKTVAG